MLLTKALYSLTWSLYLIPHLNDMSKKKLQDLKELITCLKKEEIVLAKKHLTAFESYHTKTPSRMLRVFKVILKDADIQYDRLKKLVCPDNTLKSYNQLISRTLKRVEESLILDINLSRRSGYSVVFKNRFIIRKLIIQSSILQGRGLTNYALKNFDWIIRTSIKFELYDELIETLLLKQAIVFSKDGLKQYDKISKDILFYEECRELLRKSKDIYRTYFAEISFKGKFQDKKVELKSRIAELEKYVEFTKSANISNYMYLLKMEYGFISKEYDYGLKVGKQFVNALKENPVIYSKIRIGYVYFNLSDNEISALRFNSAIGFGLSAKETLKSFKSINYVLALDFLSTAYFFNGDSVKALKELEELEKLSILKKYPFHRSKLFYHKAMIYFVNQEYRDASILLNNMTEIEKDKEGWNVWIRIMRILCEIELLKLKLIDYDVESFRKYIERTDKKYSIGEREKLVLKILLDLDKNDYDFNTTSKSSSDTIEKLRESSGTFSWNPKSPELILFHDWFLNKVENKKYIPNYDLYRKIQKKSNKKPNLNTDNQPVSKQLAIEF